MYNVGDMVIVRNDLNDNSAYYMADHSDYWFATPEMVVYAGKLVTIKEVYSHKYLCEGFDDKNDYWTDEMFTGLFVEPPKIGINDYSAACWHCREGGIIDRMAFAAGLILSCPVCGRFCDGRKVQ